MRYTNPRLLYFTLLYKHRSIITSLLALHVVPFFLQFQNTENYPSDYFNMLTVTKKFTNVNVMYVHVKQYTLQQKLSDINTIYKQ